jgi:hypothetical protein
MSPARQKAVDRFSARMLELTHHRSHVGKSEPATSDLLTTSSPSIGRTVSGRRHHVNCATWNFRSNPEKLGENAPRHGPALPPASTPPTSHRSPHSVDSCAGAAPLRGRSKSRDVGDIIPEAPQGADPGRPPSPLVCADTYSNVTSENDRTHECNARCAQVDCKSPIDCTVSNVKKRAENSLKFICNSVRPGARSHHVARSPRLPPFRFGAWNSRGERVSRSR